MRYALCLLLSPLALATFPPGAAAQIQAQAKPGKEYRNLYLPESGYIIAETLKDQLMQAKGMEGLQGLFEDITRNPEKYEKYHDLVNNTELQKSPEVGKLGWFTLMRLQRLLWSDGSKLGFDTEQLQAMQNVLHFAESRVLLQGLIESSPMAPDPPGAAAQIQPQAKPWKEYRNLPLPDNIADILKDQLMQAKGMEGLQGLFDDITRNPEKYAKYQDLVKNTKLPKSPDAGSLDPDTKAGLQKLIKEGGSDLNLDANNLKAIKNYLENHQKGPKKASVPNAGAKFDSTLKQPAMAKVQPPPDAKNDTGGGFDKLAKKALDWMEHTHFAKLDSLVNSSQAFQESKERFAYNDSLQKALANLDANGSWSFPEFNWLKLPGATAESFTGGLPSFSPLMGSKPFTLPAKPKMAPHWLRMSATLAIFLGAAFILWKLLDYWALRHAPALAARLGPWPFPPAQVATGEQLIKTFDYLALLMLGEKARTKNHRLIATDLGATPERHQAAEELALLYEKARYDPTAGELLPRDLAAARRDLCLLAGLPECAPGDA